MRRTLRGERTTRARALGRLVPLAEERKQPLGTLLPGEWISKCREQTPIHDHFWTQETRSQFGHAGKTLKEECLLVQAEAVGDCRSRHTLLDYMTGVVTSVIKEEGSEDASPPCVEAVEHLKERRAPQILLEVLPYTVTGGRRS